MRTRDPALFAATAIPAGAAALALTGILTWARSQEIGRDVPGLLLLISCLLFAVMNTVNLLLMTLWISSRGEDPGTWARHFLVHILPVEMVTIPFGCLLAFMLASEGGYLGFLLLGSMGLFMSFLL